MSAQVLILKSSPRNLGNSATLAEQVAAGVRAAGGQAESIFLSGLDIRPCDGCDFCKENDGCIVLDDMQKLYPKLLAADAILLASPIYWFTFNAQLKLCIDRWYALWVADHNAFKGKRFGVVLTYADPDMYISGGVNALHTIESMCRFIEAEITGYVCGTLAHIGDAQQHTELLQAAFELGRKLASSAEV